VWHCTDSYCKRTSSSSRVDEKRAESSNKAFWIQCVIVGFVVPVLADNPPAYSCRSPVSLHQGHSCSTCTYLCDLPCVTQSQWARNHNYKLYRAVWAQGIPAWKSHKSQTDWNIVICCLCKQWFVSLGKTCFIIFYYQTKRIVSVFVHYTLIAEALSMWTFVCTRVE